MKFTRTVVDSPSGGSVIGWLATIRPESSTLSGTLNPPNPVCVTTTSTDRVVPLSVARGVSTRVTWMSRANRSCPTPTVKTGICPRLEARQLAVERGVRGVGAVRHHDETGQRQPGELVARARSSAGPSRDAVPPYFRSAALATRSADEEKRKNRTTKRCDRASSSGLSGSASCCWTNSVRGWPSLSAIVMLRESSSRMPRKFCCGTAAFRIRMGRARQNSRAAMVARRRPTRTARSRGRSSLHAPRYVTSAPTAMSAAAASVSASDRDNANVNVPCSKTTLGYLNRSRNSQVMD